MESRAGPQRTLVIVERGYSRPLELMCDKVSEALEILAVQLNVVMPSTFDPKWLDRMLAALVNGQAMREIDHLILSAVDHQDVRRHF